MHSFLCHNCDPVFSHLPSSILSASSSSSSFAHRGAVKSVLFSADGHHLLSYGADGFLRLWDAASGRLNRGAQFDQIEEVDAGLDRKSTLAISDAGLRSTVFCPAEDDVRVFDLYTGIDLLGEETLKVSLLGTSCESYQIGAVFHLSPSDVKYLVKN